MVKGRFALETSFLEYVKMHMSAFCSQEAGVQMLRIGVAGTLQSVAYRMSNRPLEYV
jgi:hypothetical protein